MEKGMLPPPTVGGRCLSSGMSMERLPHEHPLLRALADVDDRLDDVAPAFGRSAWPKRSLAGLRSVRRSDRAVPIWRRLR